MAATFWNPLSEAYEIIDLSPILPPTGNFKNYIHTYKAAQDPSVDEDSEVTTDEWTNYEPPSQYLKNTTRYLQFYESHFISSPGSPVGETQYISTSDDPENSEGYTWASVSDAQSAMWPYNPDEYSGLSRQGPFAAGNFTTTPPEGSLKLTNNAKAQLMKFWAYENNDADELPIQRYRIYDPNGNGYIMHASGLDDAGKVEEQFEAAVLPDGWIKEKIYLKKNLVLRPAFGEGGDYGVYNYNLLRDSSDNTYHQFVWSKNGVGVNSRYQNIITWGGRKDDLIVVINSVTMEMCLVKI